MLSIIKKAYHRLPKFFRYFFSPIRFIRNIFHVLRLNTWILTGKEISTGKELCIFYAGSELNKNFFKNLAFGLSSQDYYVGKKWLWNTFKKTKRKNKNYGLLIIEIPHYLHILCEKIKCLYLPFLIHGEVTLPSYIKKDSVKTDIRRIRKNKLCFDVTQDILKLRNFYYNMYKPYITKIHGDQAHIWSYDFVKREFKKNGLFNDLLLIKKENEYIAGCLLGYQKSMAHLWTLGIKDSNLEYVHEGALGALFYFSILHSAEIGYERFNLGGSKPFFKDGVLEFKKKRGQKIFISQNRGCLIKLLAISDGTKGFLLNNPFIYEKNSEPCAAVFVKENQILQKNDFEKFYKNYYQPGLSKLVIYQFGERQKSCQIPPEFSNKIIIRSTSDIF